MHFYYDESIRANGAFIVGALVGSSVDLTQTVRAEWTRLGLNPDEFEYKSRAMKRSDAKQADLRERINHILRMRARLALVIVPLEHRDKLGATCIRLMEQLNENGHIERGITHNLYADNEIRFSEDDADQLIRIGIDLIPNCDSLKVAGIQIADHAAHVLGSILLEKLGIIRKNVPSPYPDDYKIESVSLGWELWGRIRYNFFSEVDYHPDDAGSLPYAIVAGHGLIIAEECTDGLKDAAFQAFGKSYLGCTV